VNEGGQPQRLDPIELGVRRHLDTPVHVSDMVEQRDRELAKRT
jgi:hypothetical protein